MRDDIAEAWLETCAQQILSDGNARSIEEARDLASFGADSKAKPDAKVTQPYRVIRADDLHTLPKPEWQLEPFILAGSFNLLYGPWGCGKSFLALDWCACIAAGLPWFGQPAKQGSVLYVAAEGSGGLHQRFEAWKHARGVKSVPGLFFLPEVVNLLDNTQIDRVLTTLDDLDSQGKRPSLVVFDTMARSMAGGDENSSRDVGWFIQNVDYVTKRIGISSLVIHHTGAAGELPRGSTALPGAADVMHLLKPKDAGIELVNKKTKDAASFDPWRLHLKPTLESVAIGLATYSTAMSPNERQILECVAEVFATYPVSSTRLLDESAVERSGYYRALASLEAKGFLASEKAGRSVHYSITTDGRNQLVAKGRNASESTNGIGRSQQGFLKEGNPATNPTLGAYGNEAAS